MNIANNKNFIICASSMTYDAMADAYYAQRNGFNLGLHVELPAITSLVGKLEGKRLLDLGCGYGDHAAEYVKRGACVVGVDNSKRLLAFAQAQNIKNAEFIFHDIKKKLPFPDASFDVITCSLVLDHIKDLKKLFKETHRVLKKDGRMLFSIPNPLLNQEEMHVGMQENNKDADIWGDYFRARKIAHEGIITYHRPLVEYIDAFLATGFELAKMVEPQPVRRAKKLHPLAYAFMSRNPFIVLFALKK